ncbi:MAG: hypothetical protein F4219_05045 [Gammaproteobacteria bacterium]|nr:hypothetical protein [Gammaproteobacteria bacterium]
MTAEGGNGAGPSAGPDRGNGDARARGGFAGLGPQARAALARLGFGRRETPRIGKGGAYDIGSEDFRRVCALLPDGSVRIVPAYHTGPVAAELADLRLRYDLPVTKPEPARLEEIAELQGLAAEQVVSRKPSAGQIRLRRALHDAAVLGASDLKLSEHRTHGVLRLKCGAGEFTHGPQWQPKEVEQAVGWTIGQRDGGDGKASMEVGVPAGFSIGQGGMPEGMPDGIGAFRGQLAWHGNQQRFLNLRLLPKPDPATFGDVAGLGLEEDVLAALAEERRSEAGLVIMGGSTGDGKSTTLVRNLGRLYEEHDGTLSICTVEDPIEYAIARPGLEQFAVNPGKTPEERDANFATMLMVFVRINPDVGMVSEIRTAAEVRQILNFVTSGHKVYTSVHAESAVGALFRVISFGVNPKALSGPRVVNLVLRQKLVPALCKKCAEPLTGPALARVEEWLGEEAFGDLPGPAAPLRRNRKGCDSCLAPYSAYSGAALETARRAWGGYLGRRATAEFIRVDDGYRRLLEDEDALGAEEHWLTPKAKGGLGGIPLSTRLRRLVAAGVTDFEHVTNEPLPEPLPAITKAVSEDEGAVAIGTGSGERDDG